MVTVPHKMVEREGSVFYHVCMHAPLSTCIITAQVHIIILESVLSTAVLEIMVSIQTLSDHFGILSDLEKFGSDIWLSTNQTNVHFTSADSDVNTLTDICKDRSDATLHCVCTLAHVCIFSVICLSNIEFVPSKMIVLGRLSKHYLFLIPNTGTVL